MLSITNLSKTYKGNAIPAVSDISFEVKKGEIFGFLGPNGAGKSTTIKCIMGILPYENGCITIDGIDIKANPIAAKANIGYVPDNHVIYDKLTGLEYVNFMADIYGVSSQDRKQRVEELAETFQLTEALAKPISSYSHGMKQKICVIGALVHKPKLWVLDEPMMGLDPKSSYELKQLMRKHCDEGNCVCFSSHMLEIVEKICDRVAIIDKGRLIAVKTVEEIKESRQDGSLEEFFLSVTGAKEEIADVTFD